MSSTDAILTISVAARLLDLHPRTIMLYERTGLMKPYRTGTQRRMYSGKDLDDLQFIKFLTRQKGINLQGVKLMLEAISFAAKGGVDLKGELFSDFKAEELF